MINQKGMTTSHRNSIRNTAYKLHTLALVDKRRGHNVAADSGNTVALVKHTCGYVKMDNGLGMRIQ